MSNLPPSFAYSPICLQDAASLRKTPESALPIICFRDGSPPLPDVSNTSLKDLGTSDESGWISSTES